MTPEELQASALAAQARRCVTVGCQRKRKLHYTRCEDCIRVLVDRSSTLPEPEPVETFRFERFRDRVTA